MNQGSLKTYAQQARRDFIAAVSDRAAFYGLTASGTEPIVQHGDVVLIGERPFPREVAAKRGRLESRIRVEGFEQTMEAMAYTWFNRFAAIRYMELHGYLDHGYRVLSHPEDREQPEILDHAAEVDLPDLDREKVVELKLDGGRDEELYRLLLTAQCNALHLAMPFLFERIGDETELLLPINLLHTDSLIRRLIKGIDESAWDEIEIIGWLYQFYISEKKDQVIGKVVKSEDIPAATQLFTPNWIVKYMVQNSLGAQWLATYPHSNLLAQMDYYIEPAEQTEEVKAQLAAITPSTLDPEALTLIDPACGSGHILVEAYNLFKAIYLERGYRQRDVPKLILEKNLFGLDIDARAAQLAGFAVMMKGRADDRRLFERGVKLNVTAFVNSVGLDAERLAQGMKLADYGHRLSHLMELKRLFEHATTFGSLIQVPESLAAELSALKRLSEATSQDLFVSNTLSHLGSLVQQAELLVARYDAAVANPPYMGGSGMNAFVKKFSKDHFPHAKSDLFACFMERGYALAKDVGHIAMVTMESWMFLSSYEKFRNAVLHHHTLRSLAHFPYDGKRPTAMGINFGVAVANSQNAHVGGYQGHYCCSRHYELRDDGVPVTFPTPNERLNIVATDEFKKIPGNPVAYWASKSIHQVFFENPKLSSTLNTREGLTTGSNDTFLRFWFEVNERNIGFGMEGGNNTNGKPYRWFPYQKGGAFRRWFGNAEYVVNWFADGQELRTFIDQETGRVRSHNYNGDYAFRAGLTWSGISSGTFSVRMVPEGFMFDAKGPMGFPLLDEDKLGIAGLLNSSVVGHLLKMLAPTLDFKLGHVLNLPFKRDLIERVQGYIDRCVAISMDDWNAYERSWDFQTLPVVTASLEHAPTLRSSYTAWITQNREIIAEMKNLEEENNRLFIDAYGLQDELNAEIPIEQITLTVNPACRYGGKLGEKELWARFRRDTMVELVSYAIGCMMGRYSLDAPGIIYAHSGNVGFDATRYTTFPAYSDGLVPLTDSEWFDDDATNHLVEFISVAWDVDHLENNLTFMADNLVPTRSESSHDTIRRYICDNFFKNHLQTYKNRPIYWLFSSGKYKAFQCLVYLHRYNEGTLARMRTEYVVPLQGMIASRVRQLDGDIAAATSTVRRRKLEKERGTLVKQQTELREFDEKLRHYADRRIGLDLDDGVKVNYGKFGDLLFAVTKVTGKMAG